MQTRPLKLIMFFIPVCTLTGDQQEINCEMNFTRKPKDKYHFQDRTYNFFSSESSGEPSDTLNLAYVHAKPRCSLHLFVNSPIIRGYPNQFSPSDIKTNESLKVWIKQYANPLSDAHLIQEAKGSKLICYTVTE